MKDPEYKAAEQEVYAAHRRAQAAMLRSWEKHGPEWWRRLGALFMAGVMGFLIVFSMEFVVESLEMYRSYDFGFPWEALFMLTVAIALPLGIRFFPLTRLHMRFFDWELVLGIIAGSVLTILFFPLN